MHLIQRYGFGLLRTIIICLGLGCAISTQAAATDIPAGNDNYQELVKLLDEFLAFRDPGGENPHQIIRDRAGQPIDPVTDYSKPAIEAQREQIKVFQTRIK
ncbi:MAG: hypothetical protein V2J13_10865, partial [Cycloclasticus sp.]|nr:hypothetical protein [Cycloclasticus sp.]